MAEVVASGPVLSDSVFKTRPSFQTYLKSDNNTYSNAVQQIEEQRRQRQMKFPSLIGRKDVDSFKDPQTCSNTAFKRYNDEGDHRVSAPYRACDNIVDPISGFVSVAGDVDRNTGHKFIPSLVQLNTTPQSRTPQEINSIRKGDPCAPPETQRTSENDRGTPYSWNSIQVSDAALRGSLGGWTSKVDPRKTDKQTKRSTPEEELRDKLAHRYSYTSSTQRAYEEVQWDKVLGPKQYPPTATLELRPDMISQRYTLKRYEPQAEDWQNVGKAWDRFQTRKNYYKPAAPIPGVVFCTPCPRAQQIPGYSGCIGGVNLDEIDNERVQFVPLTAKRNPQPWPTDTSHRPNIPNYAGCTWDRMDSTPAHSNAPYPNPVTTARVHRPFTVPVNDSHYRRGATMSRTITTVPPCNPYTKITQPAERIAVKS